MQSVSDHNSFGESSLSKNFAQEIDGYFKELGLLESILSPRTEIFICKSE